MNSQPEQEDDLDQEERHTFRDKRAYFQKIGGCQATICMVLLFLHLRNTDSHLQVNSKKRNPKPQSQLLPVNPDSASTLVHPHLHHPILKVRSL